jgi:hypothetical protein
MKEYCPWFDLRECDFSAQGGTPISSMSSLSLSRRNSQEDQNNKLNDESGMSRGKAGTGRVAIYNATHCVHCYTFEANYHSARHGLGWIGPSKHPQGFPHGSYCPPAVKCTFQYCVLGKAIQEISKIPPPQPMKGIGFSLGDLHSMGRSIALAALDTTHMKREDFQK